MHYEYEDVNRYRRRSIDPRTYWMQPQERPGGNGNMGSGPTPPSAPSAPSAPTRPTAPSAPSAPTRPTAPSAPSAPTRPTAPPEPTRPTAPPEPSRPTAPAAPEIPEPEEIVLPKPPSPSLSTIISVIENCMDGMVFVWLKNGDKFWMVPKSSTSKIVSGYIWGEDTGWYEDDVAFSDISSVTCVAI